MHSLPHNQCQRCIHLQCKHGKMFAIGSTHVEGCCFCMIRICKCTNWNASTLVEFCDIYPMDMWSHYGIGAWERLMGHGGKVCSLLWEAKCVLQYMFWIAWMPTKMLRLSWFTRLILHLKAPMTHGFSCKLNHLGWMTSLHISCPN